MMRLLIVEDDPDGAEMIEMLLNSVGCQTTHVTSAEAAIYELIADPTAFDVCIVDLALPQMDGFELLSHIRQVTSIRHLPLVAVTAYHTPELKVRALDYGFDAYFAKPLDTTIFVQALERLLQ